MHTDELTHTILGACFEISRVLGCGFLEKVYERALIRELAIRNVSATAQIRFPVLYKGASMGEYVADLIVARAVIVEIKCVDSLTTEHLAQCLNYLKASGLRLALLVNFQHPRLQWRRVVLG